MPPAEVKQLYPVNFRSVPATLRLLADGIEKGEYGEVGCCAVVVLGDELSVWGLGPDSEGPSVHYLLHAGAAQLLQHALVEGTLYAPR